MKKSVWPLLVIFFLAGGLTAILIGQVKLRPETEDNSVEIISEKWRDSGHADQEAEAFIHWDEDDPAEVPAGCAKCHSAYGYLDYLGEDGSEALMVEATANIGSVVTCNVCHNPSAYAKEVAYFPSGAEISIEGGSVNCAECHQGTRSGLNVTTATQDLPEDEVNPDLSFINVHYKIGGAVRYGSDAMVGYEYPGQTYAGYFLHVEDYQYCTDCHDPHALTIDAVECAACHPSVSELADIWSVRSEGTPDYDGDGDTTEGVYGEIETLHEIMYAAIQQYASEVAGTPIIYAGSFPYWYNDTNGNGSADEEEINFGNQFASWTPRLLKAAYNYHLVNEDPGGFMHNAPYLVQLMYDSINSLSEASLYEMSGLIRPE